MLAALIGIIFVFAMSAIAIRANARLRSLDHLPMQWLLPDEVVWSAPRVLALALLPTLAFATFSGLAIVFQYLRPRPGQEGLVIPALIAIGVVLLAVQVFHLWMVARTVGPSGN